MKALKEVAGPTVEFLGHVKDEELTRLVSTARAFVMPGEEDFGIAAVEAHARAVQLSLLRRRFAGCAN
jgi:glycosyltransferase involved in cell wall biosynthesis